MLGRLQVREQLQALPVVAGLLGSLRRHVRRGGTRDARAQHVGFVIRGRHGPPRYPVGMTRPVTWQAVTGPTSPSGSVPTSSAAVESAECTAVDQEEWHR
ncbi:hypothetical protein GCM10011581_18100 [Saccharopolyspora subtropica]|uniref:Uncharacterized protein n=1 Tax=Saccharopolyspora thermophila TaxID=89367 RepID=A0A917NA89_9PSEU|nr:hypothetical protein GCM10011581_18100 [Saccharopolyspora subtropica]